MLNNKAGLPLENQISKRIAVATDDNLTVAGHVGRCRAFIVFETDNSKILNKEIRENNFTNHRQQGMHNEEHQHHNEHHHNEVHSHSHHNLIDGLSDCASVIFTTGGWRLIEDLKAHNLTPILTNEKFAEDAVLKYLKGELISNEENGCSGHQH